MYIYTYEYIVSKCISLFVIHRVWRSPINIHNIIYSRHLLYSEGRRRVAGRCCPSVMRVYCKNIDHACARASPNTRRRRRVPRWNRAGPVRDVVRNGGDGRIGFKNPRGKGSTTRWGVEIRRHGQLLCVCVAAGCKPYVGNQTPIRAGRYSRNLNHCAFRFVLWAAEGPTDRHFAFLIVLCITTPPPPLSLPNVVYIAYMYMYIVYLL